MPGLDYEVHELTRQDSDAKYGCNNRGEFSAGYYAPDRKYLPDGRWFDTMTFIPHRMSTECRFDISLTDTKCNTCPRRGSGEAYDKLIRSRGT